MNAPSKRPTVREIARRTGFSKSLVALALRDDHRVAAATRKRIQQVAVQAGYQTNPVVANLMAQLRISRTPAFQSNLAVINCSHEPDVYRWHTFGNFREGVREGAARLGYGIDDFWMNEPGMRPQRLAEILRARQIPAIVFAGVLEAGIVHDAHGALWRDFPSVAVGIVKTRPQIACACCDHFQTALSAVETIMDMGYRRPALVIREELDRLLDRRFSGGFLGGVSVLPSRARLPVHFTDLADPGKFRRWFAKSRPDCIVTLHHEVCGWLEAMGVEVPGQVGLAHLDWHAGLAGWAGMIQNNREAGASAVDLVIHQLHANEKGAPACPKLTMVESEWVDGETVIRR